MGNKLSAKNGDCPITVLSLRILARVWLKEVGGGTIKKRNAAPIFFEGTFLCMSWGIIEEI